MPNTAANPQGASAEGHWLHVVAAVILSEDGRVLLARRPDHKHQGGKWEFPGGKVESGESAVAALARELHEELGIEVRPSDFSPLVEVRHRYADKAVFLDVWQTCHFVGVPEGREGQVIGWFARSALADMDFPAANRPVLAALSG